MNAIFYYIIISYICIIQICLAQKKAIQNCKSLKEAARQIVIENRQQFVVGGSLTLEYEFPHMVALGYGNLESPEFLCGGTLISDLYVLTAAHCTNNRGVGSVKMIRAGTRTLYNKNNSYQDVRVKNVITHPQYKPPSSYHDIALLRLRNKVKFAPNIRPGCLQTSKELQSRDNTLIALGWGKTNFAGPSSDNLLKVILQHSPIKECMKSYARGVKNKIPRGLLDNIQMCAGGTVGKDTCQGDSGGPLEYTKEGLHYIVGLTSFGKACGLTADPGVYTRVSGYIPWIENIVWK